MSHSVLDRSNIAPSVEDGRLFIAGAWRDASSDKRIETINPATEEVVGRISSGTDGDLDAAVNAARRALDGDWSKLTGLERGKTLNRLADALDAEAETLAQAQVAEMGKTITQSRFEIGYLGNLFRYHAGWASKLDGAVKDVPGGFHCFTTREPVGVVAAITPFNVPLYLMATKLAPALAAGCTFIHKPASATSLSALAFARVFEQAGLPAGAYNLLTGPGGELGRAISQHPGIDKVAFTGSTKVGIDIIRDAAPSMKRVTMELGGKSPHIVLADADLELATTNAVMGNFINSGQICTSGSRLIVERTIYDEMVERVAGMLATLPLGNPLDETTFFGPVAAKDAQDKIMGYIDKGRAEGARLVCGGDRATIDGRGFYIQPTVFADADNGMTIAREEIFGPVLTIIPVDDVDEAIRIANETSYGLASAVQTRDMKQAFKVSRALKAGTVWVNTEYQWNEAAPYGGFKLSGHGRENGAEAYDSYLETKTVWLAVTDPGPQQ